MSDERNSVGDDLLGMQAIEPWDLHHNVEERFQLHKESTRQKQHDTLT